MINPSNKKNYLLPMINTTFAVVVTSWSEVNIGVGAALADSATAKPLSNIGWGYGTANSDNETAFTPMI